MKVYLARHGRTNYNDLGLCNSDPAVDVHLTALGREQAASLADSLALMPIEQIYASELRRTQQTAEAINRHHGVDIVIEPRLNDGRSGFEGRSFLEYTAARDAADDKWTVRFNGGESVEDMKARVHAFLTQLAGQPYQAVLIVSSEWIIQAILCELRGLSNEQAWAIEITQGTYFELDLA